MVAPQPPQEATDIFSISDQVLADRLRFIEEIGFGNWGSVWLCRPKPDPASPSHSPHAMRDTKIAVKLVHRSKTSTTAARVRSLWNEMKVVRTFKHEPHPSIIPFYSFIITPSYALITMAFHPRLIPVEVPESHAKDWFHSLLSGIQFIHKRGVVHNDIKPANILLSQDNVPVLIDFGFAERYDVDTSNAFHSNLSYGTPEYLSPERARGLPHDTRKSDIWSLGITFFEVLIGRTPFEYSEGEQFSTKEDLEEYWNRTLSGKWVGNWKMSKGMENLLLRMILPNADLRCTASEAMTDNYWSQSEILIPNSRKATTSHAPALSLGLEKDVSKLFDIPPWSPRAQKEKPKTEREKARKVEVKENVTRSSGTGPRAMHRKADRPASALQPLHHSRSQSQPRVQVFEARGVSQTRKNAAMPSLLATLSPVKHSPPAVRRIVSNSAAAKENAPQTSQVKTARMTRKPLGPRSPTPPSSPASQHTPSIHFKDRENLGVPALEKDKGSRRSRVFRDLTGINRNVEPNKTEKRENKSSVRDRMREWERERERLREMEMLEERLKEAEEEREREREMERERERGRALEEEKDRVRQQEDRERELKRQRELAEERELAREREDLARVLQLEKELEDPKVRLGKSRSLSPPDSALVTPPLSPVIEDPSECSWLPNEVYSRSGNESGISLLKQSLKLSFGMFDKTLKLYRSSTQALGRSTPMLMLLDETSHREPSGSLSPRAFVGDELSRSTNSSLPNDEMEASTEVDRMTLWIRSVEKVVEDARQTFSASTSSDVPPPALPLSPVSRRASLTRTNRSSRVPRKILAANHIFVDEYDSSQMDQSMTSVGGTTGYFTANASRANASSVIDHTLPTIPSEELSRVSGTPAVPQTPSRRRRATVASISPEPTSKKKISLEISVSSSPSKLKEKSRSQNDLNHIGPITPVAKLEFELGREKLVSPPLRPQRLSEVVDKNIFIASSPASPVPTDQSGNQRDKSLDELTSSPFHVDPYPPRPQAPANILDTPARKHIEGVYDRFLMSTAGVKRMGRGYQSDNVGPVLNVPPQNATAYKRNQKLFHSSRRPMPPPISSDDMQACSVDEFGVVIPPIGKRPPPHDTNKTTVTIVRKAFKAIVSGKTVSTRFSKAL
ncbi:predicted protein [Sparassis crispa]|uniref:Protein kinase domain-containing protein n=1 Tax=Sparassis crispa TaxID=139825 RepID=A0A401GLI4_9APHY|nr:predicted protein [Sparassis crispa]GBE83047.1 predicted protein [Sparassis crispa]